MNYKLDNDKQVFFYEQEFYVLSNFSAFRLRWKNLDFDTSEAAYHWEKFSDNTYYHEKIRKELLSCRSAHETYYVARVYMHYKRQDWNDVKIPIMKSILEAKVDQHPYVKEKLIQTKNRELIEDSWRDDFWGWGPNKNGRNELGKLWMKIRSEIVDIG